MHTDEYVLLLNLSHMNGVVLYVSGKLDGRIERLLHMLNAVYRLGIVYGTYSRPWTRFWGLPSQDRYIIRAAVVAGLASGEEI